jgi:predicted CXXCH cytochrome family protein
MKNHVLRPLWVVLAAISLLLLARHLLVPADFGVHGETFTYGFYRQSNVDEWKNVAVKYQGKQYCADCHSEHAALNSASLHASIQCESCHGPAMDHPEDPERLIIDTSRALCLRCHAALPTPGSDRGNIAGIDPVAHNHGVDCISCHEPHNPSLENLQ